MDNTKKYIAPGGWFALSYPASWSEFEDAEGNFLFYNPEKWSGNFRISAYKDRSASYGKESIEYELQHNEQAVLKKIGAWECAYSCETFIEEDKAYTSHFWVTGAGQTAVECSFTVAKGASIAEAEQIIASLDIRDGRKRYPREVIPVRVLEINEINMAYDWAASHIKKLLKKDFTSSANDLSRMQDFIAKGDINPRQREAWQALGLTFGTVLVNEMDGMDWVTVIEGTEEYPALRFADTDVFVYPLDLLWNKVAKGEVCDLKREFEQVKASVENVL